MSSRRSHRSTTLGLVLLAAAVGLSLVAMVLGPLWSLILSVVHVSPTTAASLHAFWIPLSSLAVDAVMAFLGILGFLLIWRGRWELGSEHASRVGLAMLAALIGGVAYALYAVTGILLGYVVGVDFLVPWHALLGVVGGVFVGLALYWILANLGIAGARPLAAVALALGFAGIALLNLAAFGLRRVRPTGLEGAGLGLALASLTLWLVLCLWGEETLRSRPLPASAATATPGS